MSVLQQSPNKVRLAAWCIAAAALFSILWLHLLPALLAGLLVFETVHVLTPRLQRRFPRRRVRVVAVVALSTLVVAVLTGVVLGAVAFFRSDAGSLPSLFQKMADLIDGSRGALPAWLVASLPPDADALREWVANWLRVHAPEVQLAGAEVGRAIAHLLIGMVIGAVLSLHEARPARDCKPLDQALSERAARLGDAFRRVVFAQLRISALNTLLTGAYLLIVLPACGIHLPLTKTIIVVTFVAGLLPVIGNLISNTVIVVVSLAASLYVAIGSLIFLVVIHKLEYFLNARIVGTQVRARMWELLTAMLVMEAAFGLAGLIAAPVYYAYLKRELVDADLV